VGDAGVVRSEGNTLTKLPSLCNFLLPISKTILTGGQSGEIFDATSGVVVWRHHSPLNCGTVCPSPGGAGNRAVVGSYTGEAIVLSQRSDESWEVQGTWKLHQNAIKGLAQGDGLLFSVCADSSVAIHDARTGKERMRLPGAHDRIVNGCGHLSNGVFYSVSRDRTLRLWNEKGSIAVIDTPHTHSIKCCAASSDARFIATGSYNGVVAVYDAVASGWVGVSRVTHAGISSIDFDATASAFVASSYDGKLYEIPVRQEGRS
jgi:WD40 repeat protein